MFQEGRRKGGRFFAVHWLATEASAGRLGLVVSKKLAGNGVQRNRVKRLTREVYRRTGLQWRGVDIVVRLRAPISASDWVLAAQELHRMLGGVP